MPFNIDHFTKSLSSAFKKIKSSQAEALAIEIAANYTAGRTAGQKHQSIKSADPEPKEDEGLTTEEKAEIALLVALFLGYTSKFNDSAQAQILEKAKEIIDAGGSPEEVQQYVQDVFEGKEPIKIDNTGKTKKEIYVDQNLKLSEVSKKIEKPFYASVLTYAAMTGENASHAAYEGGRKAYNISQGFEKWIFVGPADEVARAHHVAIIGERYTYGTLQSEYAERCLREYRCRHRAEVFRNDGTDTKPEVWEKLKADAGLFFNEKKQKWELK